MMKKNILTTVFAILIVGVAKCQSVGINTSTPSQSSIFDVKVNGTHKSMTFPVVSLISKTDKTVIQNSNPAESLLIYNSNENIQGGKGIYFWNNDDNQWEFMVSQANISLFRDLTRYYTAETQNSLVLSSTPTNPASGYVPNSNTANWTMIKSAGSTDLSIPINVDQAINFLEINLTGTWLVHTNSNTTSVNRSYDLGYGIFVDGQLKYVRTDTAIGVNPCNISNFYVNTIIPNISTGSHTITFGVMLRRVRTSGTATTFPTNTTIKIGGPSTGATTGCKSINAFESSTKATVFVNQTL